MNKLFKCPDGSGRSRNLVEKNSKEFIYYQLDYHGFFKFQLPAMRLRQTESQTIAYF